MSSLVTRTVSVHTTSENRRVFAPLNTLGDARTVAYLTEEKTPSTAKSGGKYEKRSSGSVKGKMTQVQTRPNQVSFVFDFPESFVDKNNKFNPEALNFQACFFTYNYLLFFQVKRKLELDKQLLDDPTFKPPQTNERGRVSKRKYSTANSQNTIAPKPAKITRRRISQKSDNGDGKFAVL